MKIINDIVIEGNLIKKSKIKIHYKGKFTKEFSNEVFIMYGYGLGWKGIQEQKMQWTGDEFFTEIYLQESGEFNFCFKNDFGIWDNNNGNDYSVEIKHNETSEEKKKIFEDLEKNDVSKVIIDRAVKTEEKNQEISKENKKIDKKDMYKRVHIPEKENKKIERLKDNEESLFEYVNNLKKYEDKYSAITDTENTKTKTKKEKKVKTKKSKVKKFFRLIFILIILFAAIYYGINFSKIKNIQNENKNLLNVEINKENLKEGKNQVTERMLQVQALNKEYPDLKAWIEIKDTVINYPVMQRNDNSFYVNHNYKKEYSKWGSLFLDKDFDWSIPSSNLLIYGHNFSDGLMFADLLKYRDEEFYKNHQKIRFTTVEEDVEYDILAVFNSRVYYKSEKNVFRYYFFVDAQTEEEFDEYVNNAKKASIYKNDIEAEYGDQLLTLSTCDYSQEDGRFVVVARKIND